MNKHELLKQYDEKAKALRDEFISKLENKPPYPKFRFIYPRKDEDFYFIDLDGKVFLFDDEIDDLETCFEQGVLFSSEEEAQAAAQERKLLFKLHQWAKIKNEGWEPDWEDDDEEKYFITYFKNNSINLSWEITWGMINFTKLPYFKTVEITQECIELFGDEIKEVFKHDRDTR